MASRFSAPVEGDLPSRDALSGAPLSGGAGVWLWDVANSRLYADARFAELYGLSTEDAAAGLATEAFFLAIHPDDRMRIRIAVAGVMYGADIFAKEFRVPAGSGGFRWVSARGGAERDADFKVVRFSGVLSDITDQKRVEERLRVAQSAGGVGTFEYVSGFGTVEVSEQFCRLLGLSPTDTLPLRTINAVLPEGEGPLISGSESLDGGMLYNEFLIVRPDTGERRWIARRCEQRYDGVGGGQRLIGVIYDITDFKTVEDKLRRLTATLEQSVEARTRERDRVWNNSRDLLAIIQPDGVMRSVSPSWRSVLGYQPDEVIGWSYVDFIHPDDHAATAEALLSAAGAHDLTDFENRYRDTQGEYRWISWRTSLEDGLIYAYGRDVTEEKARDEDLARTEEQLRQAQKMEAVGQLTGGLAHDFNNMLTGIIGSLEIVGRRLNEGRYDDVPRFMEAATTSAQRAAGLTHRLLAFSRQQSLDPKALDVNDLVRSMEDLLVRTLGEQIAFQARFADQVWPAVSDANQLESAVLNLAINARDAMPEGGRLTIETQNAILDATYARQQPGVVAGDYVEISVSDTGHGMAPEVVAKAFDPFFTTKPIGQGTGLGLSMIYGFMRQIGGHVRIYSEIGKGTTTKLYLPRFVGEDAPAEPEHRPAAPASGSGEMVLVVEDDASVRGVIVEVLRELGYSASQASDSQAAMPFIVGSSPIDLLITDVGLPGMNGRQLAEIALEHRPSLKVLFVTGYAASAAVRGNFLADGMDMISKPFAMNDLAAKIREMIAK
jgi:PAS domain S-box-containing protein